MTSPWFRFPRPRPNATHRLFVFHHAGGSSSAYFKWHTFLPENFELALVELPGRGHRHQESLLESFTDLRPRLLQAIRPLTEKPFLFYGHSMGALIAFDVAEQLHATKASLPELIGVSSFVPPTAYNLAAREPISNLGDTDFLKKIERYAPVPRELTQDASALAFFLPILRADIKLIESYSRLAQAPLPVPLAVYGGHDDLSVPPARLQDWSQVTSRVNALRIFAGHHFFIREQQEELLRDFVAHAQKKSS